MNLKMLVLAGLLGVPGPALAHDSIGPHGGRVVDAGEYHVELVAKQTALDVFITDAAHKSVAAAGFKGLAILVVDGKSHRIALEPVDDGRLSGNAGVTLPARPKGVVRLTGPGGKTSQGKFD